MSRIGNKIITIPAGVTVEFKDHLVTVKGKLGTLNLTVKPVIDLKIEGSEITVVRANEEKHTKQLHGTTRANIQNMIVGVSEGYKKELVIVGIGYRCQMLGQNIEMSLGFSHKKIVKALPNTKIEAKSQTEIIVTGIDKQAVGEVAALIRACREPEPFKGKGVSYVGEKIRRKEGKKAAKK